LKTRPEGLDESRLVAALADGWDIAASHVEYRPVGGGSYHWLVTDRAGKRYFVTADDLDHKGYLGSDRDSAFEALRCALDTAHALRHDAGLEFVVAPLPTVRSETVRPVGARHAVAVYPFIEGPSPGWGATLEPHERATLVRMLAGLHDVNPVVAPRARPVATRLPELRKLERALRELDVEWGGGPFSEPARALLAEHAAAIHRLMGRFDELVQAVEAAKTKPVVTHGEPHGGNLLRAGGELLFIDWDTVGLAPRERDLWILGTASPGDLDLYSEVSGRSVDVRAIALYRIRWQLDDISLFVDDLRSPHQRTADTEHAWRALVESMPTT
jgi:spectinomycin phosphotransferase